MADRTVDPSLRTWVPVPEGSDFPIQNLPYGVFRTSSEPARVGVAIGEHVLDLAGLGAAGLLPGEAPGELFAAPALNPFLASGPPVWRAVRARLSELLSDPGQRPTVEPLLIPMGDIEPLLPVRVGDFVDFYSSLEHATNMGRMFRPDQEPLLPNWRHLPVGYHGRSATVVVSGTPVVRPLGQTRPENGSPGFGPSRLLDFELEVGFVTGPANRSGEAIPTGSAPDHIFGMVLVNDWSARDIQAWEYVPLGPFLGKSFATSISPWVVPLDALEPFRVPGPPQEPEPLPYLQVEEPRGLNLELEVSLQPAEGEATVVSRTNLRHMYWNPAQQLAHATVNGAVARPGDLFASGTVSGPDPDGYGSLMELTWRGENPIILEDGSPRTFLEDGDTVVMRGWAGGGKRPRVGFGEVRGKVQPAGSG